MGSADRTTHAPAGKPGHAHGTPSVDFVAAAHVSPRGATGRCHETLSLQPCGKLGRPAQCRYSECRGPIRCASLASHNAIDATALIGWGNMPACGPQGFGRGRGPGLSGPSLRIRWRRQLSRGRLKPRAIAPCGGEVLYRQVERLAEAGDRAEGGGREPTGLDLAQRLRRHAGRARHVTEIAVCSRFTQQPPETPTGLDLFGRERIANHGTTVRLVF